MKLMKKLISLIVLVLIFYVYANGQKITLRKAIEEAMINNPDIQQQQQRLMQTMAVNNSGVGLFLPKITVTGGYMWFNSNMELNMKIVKPAIDEMAGLYGASIAKDLNLSSGSQEEISNIIVTGLGKLPDDNVVFDFNRFPNASITAVQPVFAGGKIISAKNTAELVTNISQAEMTTRKNIITKQVVEKYYLVVLLQALVQTRELAVKDMKIHSHNTNRLIETGVLPKHNKLRTEVALAKAERMLDDEKTRLEIAKASLNITIGYPEDSLLIPEDSLFFKIINISVEQMQEDARISLPVFQLTEQKIQLAKQHYNSTRANMFPQIFAYANYSFFNDYLPVVTGPFSAGVQLRYNIFNGMTDYNKLQASKYMIQEAEIGAEKTAVKVDFLIDKAYKQVESSKARYLKLSSTIALAEENYRITKKRFEQGLNRSVDVIDAYSLLENARVERLFALYAYYTAINNLYFASGKSYEIAEILN
jgi:outer membrane protein TolC